jgi:hypothetical protein
MQYHGSTLHEDKNNHAPRVFKDIYPDKGALATMRNAAQYFSGRTVIQPSIKQGTKQHINAYENKYKHKCNSDRVGKAVSVSQLSPQQCSAMMLLMQHIALATLKEVELRAQESQKHNLWGPIEARLKSAHKQQSMPAAVEEQQPPAEAQQQREPTAKPSLEQNGPVASSLPVEDDPAVADSVDVLDTSVPLQASSMDQDHDRASSTAVARDDKACSTAVEGVDDLTASDSDSSPQQTTCSGLQTEQRSWCRRAASVAWRIAAVVVVARKVGRRM